jgi:hypothetical protein
MIRYPTIQPMMPPASDSAWSRPWSVAFIAAAAAASWATILTVLAWIM